MAFFQFFLRLALAVSVTLAVTQVEDPLTITCQNIRHDSTFEFDALEKRNSNEISLENCKIDTPSNYSSENKLRCSSCSVLGIGGGLRKGKIVSETVRLNLMKLHERTKRQGDTESPLQTSSFERVLQTGHTYQLPCPVVTPGDVISDIVWFKGSSCDPKKRQLILRHNSPPGGKVINEIPHYQFTDTNYGLVIKSSIQTDSDRYWCKAYQVSIGKYVEDFLDLIVLGKTFPMHRWPNTVGDIQSITVNFKEEKVVTCPVMSQTGFRLVDVTMYWSRLNTSTDDGQSMDIVFPDNGVATTGGRYSLDAHNNLVVNKFNDREEMYCCHVFQDGIYPRQSCVRVVWTAIQEKKYPVISGCGDVTTPEDQCDVRLESGQDFFQLECFVNNVYPRPEVSWSVIDCDDKNDIGFSTGNDWTYDNASMTYNATAKLYLHNFPLRSFSSTFNCTSLGGAITIGRRSSSVEISRGVVEAQCSCNCVLVFLLTVIFTALLGIMFIGCLLKMASARTRRFSEMDEEKRSGITTQIMLRLQSVSTPMESSPMMSQESKGDANAILKGPGFLVSRTTSDIIFTDDTYNWISVGQLVTNSFSLGDVDSGFQYIRDIIPVPTQDGGLIIIDSMGMYQFTLEYLYKFVHLYKQLPGGYLCVAYFTTNKLLFGLVMGRLVIFDSDKLEVATFGSILPVGHTEVELADISVDSQGFVFAGDSKGKAISIFDPDGVYITRVEINIAPNFLYAHTTEMKVDLFVSSESTVEKYGVDRKSRNPYRAMMGDPKYIIDGKAAQEDSFHSGGVIVRGDKLFLVNKLDDDKNVQVLQRDEVGGGEEHRFVVAVSEDEVATVTSRGIKGIAFVDVDEILIYFDDAVHIFKKTDKILSSEPAAI